MDMLELMEVEVARRKHVRTRVDLTPTVVEESEREERNGKGFGGWTVHD